MIVKVCGVSSDADARAAIEAGANALGFNFWPRSPRYLSPEQAAAFVPALSGILKVGVFVDSPPEDVARVVRLAGLDVAQLHGSAAAPAGVTFWRAAAVQEPFDPTALADEGAQAYLLDAPAGSLHGGTGKTFDWSLIRAASRNIVVAGGLDASNVAHAISTARPWGVDACSKLESSPGAKDRAKVAAFVAAALAAAHSV